MDECDRGRQQSYRQEGGGSNRQNGRALNRFVFAAALLSGGRRGCRSLRVLELFEIVLDRRHFLGERFVIGVSGCELLAHFEGPLVIGYRAGDVLVRLLHFGQRDKRLGKATL